VFAHRLFRGGDVLASDGVQDHCATHPEVFAERALGRQQPALDELAGDDQLDELGHDGDAQSLGAPARGKLERVRWRRHGCTLPTDLVGSR
jgi:hypothetical protein